MDHHLLIPVCVFALVTLAALGLVAHGNARFDSRPERFNYGLGVVGSWLMVTGLIFALTLVNWAARHPAGSPGHMASNLDSILSQISVLMIVLGALAGFVAALRRVRVAEREERRSRSDAARREMNRLNPGSREPESWLQ